MRKFVPELLAINVELASRQGITDFAISKSQAAVIGKYPEKPLNIRNNIRMAQRVIKEKTGKYPRLVKIHKIYSKPTFFQKLLWLFDGDSA